MTHRELLENALLDAFSLLDDEERGDFNQAFQAAPPHIQAQIRREQTRLSQLDALLPDVAPPAALRARVIEAVRAAIAERQAAQAQTALRLHDPDTIARLPAVTHRRKVAAVWRAIALGCAAASVALGVTAVHLQGVLTEMRGQEDQLVSAIRKNFGPDYVIDALVDPATRRVSLTSMDSTQPQEQQPEAALWMHPDWRTAKLFGINLPATTGSQYKLVVLDEHDRPVRTISEFTFTGGLLNEEIPMTVAIEADRLAIISGAQDDTDSVLLGIPDMVESH
jgi:anti-sigma-K factor RskA